MKRILCLSLFLIFLSGFAYGADTKISALPENATPTSDDLLITVDDPSGTPVSQKATIANVLSAGNYKTTFDNSDLSSGVLTVTHSLGEQYPHVTMVDGTGVPIDVPVSYTNTTAFTVDFSAITPLSGTWNVRVSL